MAGNLSNYAEKALMDWLMGGATPTRPTSRYVALHTGAPGEAGSANELSGNGYARQAATFGAAGSTSGDTSNTNAQTFTASGGDFGAITHASIWDASSGGNCLWQGTATNKTVADGDSYIVAIGALTLSLD